MNARLRSIVLTATGLSLASPAACSRGQRQGNAQESSAASPSSAATQNAGQAAAEASAGTAKSSATAPSSTALLDLVHRTTTRVVSSSHGDAKSRVEFAVDDLEQSAWRPNPPDPEPWLELQFAHGVQVHAATVHPGEQTTAVARMVVRSPQLGQAKLVDGAYVFETKIPVSLDRLRITMHDAAPHAEGKPGAAVEVRELRVKGVTAPEYVGEYALPEGRAHRNNPYASVNAPKFRSWWGAAPYADADAMCAAYEQAMGLPKVSEIPEYRKFAYCYVPTEELNVAGTRPPFVKAVRGGWIALTPDDGMGGGETAGLLFVQTDKGWAPANLWGDNSSYDGMCPGMHVNRAKVERSFWEGDVVVQERSRIYLPPTRIYDYDKGLEPLAIRSLVRCTVSERLTCREQVLAYGAPDLVTSEETIDPLPVPPHVWDWERSYSTTDNGWLRMSPCRKAPKNANGEPTVVPCYVKAEGRVP